MVLLNTPNYLYKLKYPSITRRVVYQYYIDFGFSGSLIIINTTTFTTIPLLLAQHQHSPSTMESIEEQWNPSSSPDIVSDSWMNIIDAKKAVKIWILDRGESWGRYTQNNKTRLQLHCILLTCPFYIRIAQKKNGLFGVTSHTPHNCPPSTHSRFKPRNSAWYLASLVERDVYINRHIKPKEIRERAGLYHQLQNVHYMPAWRARERLRNTIDGDEGVSFSLIPDWIDRVKEADNSTSIQLKNSKRHTIIGLRLYLLCSDQ